MPVLNQRDPRPVIVLACHWAPGPAARVGVRAVEWELYKRLPAAHVEKGAATLSANLADRGVAPTDIPRVVSSELRSSRAHDLVLVLGAPGPPTSHPGLPANAARPEDVRITLPGLAVCALAVQAQPGWFAENRRGLLRTLGSLPPEPTSPYVVVDADLADSDRLRDLLSAEPGLYAVLLPPTLDSQTGGGAPVSPKVLALDPAIGADELAAAVGKARDYLGSDPVVVAIRRGVSAPSPEAVAVYEQLDTAAAVAVDAWRVRGSPGGSSRVAPSRRGIERALMQCRLLTAQRDLEDTRQQFAAVVGSRSWRLTETLRATRRRLGR